MRARYLFVMMLLLGLSTPVLSAQVTYRLPQIANGDNLISTTFVLVNDASSDATVTLSFFDKNGAPLSVPVPGLTDGPVKVLQLAAGKTRFLTTDKGASALVAGSATVTSVGAEIGVSAIFTIFGGDGSFALTEAGVAASQSMTSFALAVDTTGPFNTGLAITNLGAGQTTLTFSLYDESGALVGTTTRQMSAGGHLAVFVDDQNGLFPTLGDFRGRLVVSATDQVAALTLRQNSAVLAPLTTLPVVSTANTQKLFRLPDVANGSAGGVGIKTQFVIFSLGQAGTVNIHLADENGSPFAAALSDGQTGSDFTFPLPANGAAFVETTGTGSLTAGSAQIESSVPIGVSSVFSLLDAQGNITVEAGVGDSPVRKQFTLPVDLTSGFNTGVALQNVSSTETAHVSFTLYDDAGAVIAASPNDIAVATVPPRGHLTRFVSELSESIGAVQGQLAISSDVALAGIGLRQGARTLTTLPVVPGIYEAGGGSTSSGENLLPKTITGVDLSGGVAPAGNGTAQAGSVELDIQLDAGFELSGTLGLPPGFTGFGGPAAMDDAGHIFTGLFSQTGDTYSLIVPAGTYHLLFCGFGSDVSSSLQASSILEQQSGGFSGTILSQRETDVVVSGDTNLGITVPDVSLAAVSGTVGGLGKLPSDVSPQGINVVFVDENSRTQAMDSLDSGGGFSVELAPGAYTATLLFTEIDSSSGQIRSSVLYDVGTVNVGPGGASGVSLNVPDLVEVTGAIRQPETQDYAGGVAYAQNLQVPTDLEVLQCVPASVGASYSSSLSDGSYSLIVPQGQSDHYFASLPAGGDAASGQLGQINFPLIGTNLHSFDADAQLDITGPAYPPEVELSGVVTDPNGAPVEGVYVTAASGQSLVGAGNAAFTITAVTDAQGHYSMKVLAGTDYLVDARPPVKAPGAATF